MNRFRVSDLPQDVISSLLITGVLSLLAVLLFVLYLRRRYGRERPRIPHRDMHAGRESSLLAGSDEPLLRATSTTVGILELTRM